MEVYKVRCELNIEGFYGSITQRLSANRNNLQKLFADCERKLKVREEMFLKSKKQDFHELTFPEEHLVSPIKISHLNVEPAFQIASCPPLAQTEKPTNPFHDHLNISERPTRTPAISGPTETLQRIDDKIEAIDLKLKNAFSQNKSANPDFSEDPYVAKFMEKFKNHKALQR